LLLPWFPSRSKKNKDNATKALFVKIYGIVEMRRHAAVPSSDAIDVMISQGHSTETIVGFVLGVIFAGVLNTGINACWNIVYVGLHPEWKAKVKVEVDSLLAKYMVNHSDPLHKRLAAIPVSAWEDEMPVFDAVTRETLRLALNGTALRRNLLDSVDMAGGTVEKGDFIAYSLADVHLNPEIYNNPNTFDPARFGPGREEDKKGTFSYLGWGAGRHPCTGMKVAKLEMKVIVAYMLAGYNYEIVDKNGSPVKTLPVPNRNDIHQSRPAGEPCFVDFKRTVN
jgi:sterol 14-demethylase